MNAVTIKSNELKKMMRETFIDILTERKDLIENAVDVWHIYLSDLRVLCGFNKKKKYQR